MSWIRWLLCSLLYLQDDCNTLNPGSVRNFGRLIGARAARGALFFNSAEPTSRVVMSSTKGKRPPYTKPESSLRTKRHAGQIFIRNFRKWQEMI